MSSHKWVNASISHELQLKIPWKLASFQGQLLLALSHHISTCDLHKAWSGLHYWPGVIVLLGPTKDQKKREPLSDRSFVQIVLPPPPLLWTSPCWKWLHHLLLEEDKDIKALICVDKKPKLPAVIPALHNRAGHKYKSNVIHLQRTSARCCLLCFGVVFLFVYLENNNTAIKKNKRYMSFTHPAITNR